MSELNPQASSRAAVLMPTLVEGTFDYLVPEGTAEGALVEAKLARRHLVGAVWAAAPTNDALELSHASRRPHAAEISEAQGAQALLPKTYTVKPVARVLETLPLRKEFRQWLDWVSEFTLAPKGAVLSLCGLAHAAKTTRRKFEAQAFDIHLPMLTAEQEKVADVLMAMVQQVNPFPFKGEGTSPLQSTESNKPILLDGVTGSGKTEVYFHAMAAAIATGKQILVMLPEIALTHQWLERFETTFGITPCVWHSRMTQAAKTRSWQAVVNGDVRVVVGARSSLFLPFRNLGLIVIDEEHDPSYKQEDGVLYHARDMAVVRARFETVPLILASATPSLETLENVAQGKYRAVHLTSRYGAAGMPHVRLIDMRLGPPERGQFISPAARTAMLETLARGEQVLLFMNRRGYAPLLLCRACGHRFQCSHCSAWLVIHASKSREGGLASPLPPERPAPAARVSPWKDSRLECHHCNHKEALPKACPACNADGDTLVACGPGVERIADEVRAMFAGETEKNTSPKLVVLSSDETLAAETWGEIEAGNIDILIGTQMAAKGHHFPKLTLVVVIDADVGLDGADLRTGERSYQLLHQLSGRAGRGEHAGTVLVQTYLPEHAVMKALVAQDRDRLMALEAKERERGGWPPFGQLAAILLDGVDEAKVRAAGQMLARTAPVDARIRVLGPAPAPLSKLRGQYRYRLLVKAMPGVHLQRTLKGWLKGQKFSGVRIKVDVNPYYFM